MFKSRITLIAIIAFISFTAFGQTRRPITHEGIDY